MKKDFSPTVKKLKDVPMENFENTSDFENLLTTKKYKVLYDKMLWGEGPCYIPHKQMLVWSDIPNNRMLKLIDGKVTEFRNPSNFCNGNTLDNEENLISCSHGGRCLYRTKDFVNTTVLVNSFEGKKLNSPNDVCVQTNDNIWFTDPPYGISSDYEGYKADQEYDGCYVFRFNPKNKKLDVMLKNLKRPNGITFSNDEKKIYISDTGDGIKHLYSFDLEGRYSSPYILLIDDLISLIPSSPI